MKKRIFHFQSSDDLAWDIQKLQEIIDDASTYAEHLAAEIDSDIINDCKLFNLKDADFLMKISKQLEKLANKTVDFRHYIKGDSHLYIDW